MSLLSPSFIKKYFVAIMFLMIVAYDFIPHLLVLAFVQDHGYYFTSKRDFSTGVLWLLVTFINLAGLYFVAKLFKAKINIPLNISFTYILLLGFAMILANHLAGLGMIRGWVREGRPLEWLVYGINNGLSIFILIQFWKERHFARHQYILAYIYVFMKVVLLGSVAAWITLGAALLILLRQPRVIHVVLIAFIVFGGAYIEKTSKFTADDPSAMASPDGIKLCPRIDHNGNLASPYTELQDPNRQTDWASWVLTRLAIRQETFWIFLDGNSILQDPIGYYKTLAHVFENRTFYLQRHLLGAEKKEYNDPKSIGAAIYCDAKGFYFAGSSPGLNYGLTMSLWGAGIGLLMIAFCMRQLGLQAGDDINIWRMWGLTYLLSNYFADISEIQLIVSLNFINFMFILASILLRFPVNEKTLD